MELEGVWDESGRSKGWIWPKEIVCMWRSQRINKNTVFLKSVSFLKETGTGANLFKYPWSSISCYFHRKQVSTSPCSMYPHCAYGTCCCAHRNQCPPILCTILLFNNLHTGSTAASSDSFLPRVSLPSTTRPLAKEFRSIKLLSLISQLDLGGQLQTPNGGRG